MEQLSKNKCFGGTQEVYRHASEACRAPMNFGIFLPEESRSKKVPVLYWLSGLTCTEQNFIQKAGAQRLAAKYGVAVIACDTSPRQTGIAGEDGRDDFGSGAGFYVDATVAPWSSHYQMYTYVSEELPNFIARHFPIDAKKQGIFGHSMGGHGALVIGLRNRDKFQSISAFAPICAPTQAPWGVNAFTGYLGPNRKDWESYDAHLLMEKYGYDRSILIDQGSDDKFLKDQLKPELLEEKCRARDVSLQLRLHPGYDHSYFFISTFLEDHFSAFAGAASGLGSSIGANSKPSSS